jgi:hypothetical protein
MQDIVYTETHEAAEAKRDDFVHWCKVEGYQRAGEILVRDWDRMVTLYRFPHEHWRHLRTDVAKRYKIDKTSISQGIITPFSPPDFKGDIGGKNPYVEEIHLSGVRGVSPRLNQEIREL